MSTEITLYDTVEAIAAEFERRKHEILAVVKAAEAAELRLDRDFLTEHKREAWRRILEQSNARQWMSSKQESEVTSMLYDKPQDLPEITVEGLRQWLQDLITASPQMITDLCREAFETLTPQKRQGRDYKSNEDKREIPKSGRVVLTWMCDQDRRWATTPKLSYSESTRQRLNVLDRVFSLLDGRVKPEGEETAISLCDAASQREENEAVTFWGRMKMHFNGNLHIWLTRPDLVKRLAEVAAGKNLGQKSNKQGQSDDLFPELRRTA